jgi:hypothetical protein
MELYGDKCNTNKSHYKNLTIGDYLSAVSFLPFYVMS